VVNANNCHNVLFSGETSEVDVLVNVVSVVQW